MGFPWFRMSEGQTTEAIAAAQRFALMEAQLQALIDAGPGGAVNYVHSSNVVVPHAQIITLPSMSKELVAAPGANRALLPLPGFIVSNIVVGYGNISVGYSSFDLFWGDGSLGPFCAVIYTNVLLSSSASTNVGLIVPGPSIGSGDYAGSLVSVSGNLSAAANQALNLTAYNDAGDYEDGDPDNTLVVTMPYLVVNTTTGALVAAA